MKNKPPKIDIKAKNGLEQVPGLISELLRKNPEISLAKEIMDQNKKTQKTAMTVDQSNYYQIPFASGLTSGS